MIALCFWSGVDAVPMTKHEGMTSSGRMRHCVDCRAAILAANKKGTAAKIAALQSCADAMRRPAMALTLPSR
jgi:hypothetical protein